MIGNIVILIIFVLFAGFVAYQMLRKKKDSNSSGGIGDSPPSNLRGVSFSYCPFGTSWERFVDMLAEYKVNMCRVFAYCGWSNFAPFEWGRYMGDLNPERVGEIRRFKDYCNSKGIWVILSMTQNNGGGGTENITSVPKGELATYISRMVEAIGLSGIIYETANEVGDKGFQEFVLSKLKENGVRWTCSFVHDIGATYISIHTLVKNYIGGGVIHSNDVGGYTGHYNNGDYINIARQAKEQGGHFEFLMFWSRNGELHSPDEIKRDYGDVLENIKSL